MNEAYWTHKYLEKNTGWDIGTASKPILQYLDQISHKDIKILIPGAGNAYEAKFAFESGFKNVNILDFSPIPLQNFKRSCPSFPEENIHCMDFFEHKGNYDLILEQTFFCALPPIERPSYVEKMFQLLKPGGKLVGVLFSRNFDHPGPPFGGSKQEYETYFTKYFDKIEMNDCYNSIPPRLGFELFIKIQKFK
ncbi:methyltransferase domain-containing protein [Shivajiella indica]|uniref:Methyltransferase domain-containing protein n=1 Tax=Shivajiella indica TaxID=872115 RepID=A0ABW5BCK5_9BACT